MCKRSHLGTSNWIHSYTASSAGGTASSAGGFWFVYSSFTLLLRRLRIYTCKPSSAGGIQFCLINTSAASCWGGFQFSPIASCWGGSYSFTFLFHSLLLRRRLLLRRHIKYAANDYRKFWAATLNILQATPLMFYCSDPRFLNSISICFFQNSLFFWTETLYFFEPKLSNFFAKTL